MVPARLPTRSRRLKNSIPTQTPNALTFAHSAFVLALTNREIEILPLLEQRLRNKEIAEKLFISPETVKRHTINIYGKLDVHSRREAVDRANAMRWGCCQGRNRRGERETAFIINLEN